MLTRPITMVFLAIAVLFIFGEPIKKHIISMIARRKSARGEE